MSSYERKVNYYETDQMGVVHHSNYFRYLEEARTFQMDLNNIPYKELEDNGILIPVTGLSCEYKVPALFGDTLVIYSYIENFTKVRMTVRYEIKKKGTEETVATAKTAHCFVDENLRPINLAKKSSDIYERFVNAKWS